MSKNEVLHVVRRDSLSKEVPGERQPGEPQAGDSIPGAWAVPAEAASGLPRSVNEAKGAPVGVIAVVVIAVAGALGGLYWMNQNSSEPTAIASTTPPTATPPTATPPTATPPTATPPPAAPPTATPPSATPPTATPTTATPPAATGTPTAAAPPEAPRAPSISMDSKPPVAPVAVAKVETPVVESPVTEEPVELPVQKKAKAMNRRAERAIERGRYRTAARLLSDALKLDPTYAPLQRNLGVARARLGNVSGARKAYEAYIRLAPNAPDAPDVRRILGQ